MFLNKCLSPDYYYKINTMLEKHKGNPQKIIETLDLIAALIIQDKFPK